MLNIFKNAKSGSIVYTAVKENSKIRDQLIAPKVKSFFDSRKIENYSEINSDNTFSDIDYISYAVGMDYIYDYVLSEIHRDVSGAIKIPVKYILTVDKYNCPQKCKFTGMSYDSIELNDYPFLFFLYIDIDHIIKSIRGVC